jgi:hypothetical protein
MANTRGFEEEKNRVKIAKKNNSRSNNEISQLVTESRMKDFVKHVWVSPTTGA